MNLHFPLVIFEKLIFAFTVIMFDNIEQGKTAQKTLR